MSTRRAFAFSFVDRYATLIINMASAMVIARLLKPAEIGVYSLTMVLLSFIATFRDLGAGQYLVQKQDLTNDHVRATWAVQLGLGLAFSVVIAAASIPVARFYAEPRMIGIMLVLAANFALTPFQALPYAALTRDMRFDALAKIRVTGAVAQAACAIGLVVMGLGPVALAWANLAATAAGGALAFVIIGRRLPWRPRLAGVRQVISFGGRLTGVSFMTSLRQAAPELFLGKLQGMHDTGLYSRGQGLVVMFERLVMDAVNAVAFPMYAKELREGRDVTGPFLRAVALISALGWSFLVCLAILAFPLVRVLYGTQWDAAVDPTRWLAVAMTLAVPVHCCLAPMLASGAVVPLLRVATLSTVTWAICAGIGASLGILALSQALLPAAAISSGLWLYTTRQQIRFSWRSLWITLGKSALVASASAVVPLAVSLTLGWRSEDLLLALAVALPGAAAGFATAACLTRHPVWDEIVRVVMFARP